ncbi:hypothetical protein [Caballeronia sp. LZ001]|uniref:hypothetical protein n=1 Tax=Caballeronia sp. LZ001 TaxID=3038553 RepID=UPI0028596441|nr:hypothetical protein [Caballeronia sp. LZ001]MDR5801903.1 hypothetical protein [Caballeronia sp. LZ001]
MLFYELTHKLPYHFRSGALVLVARALEVSAELLLNANTETYVFAVHWTENLHGYTRV